MGTGGKGRELPFVTVITDLGGAHPTWFDKEADKVFLASEAVMRVAFKIGVDSRRIHHLGLPTRPAFWTDARPKQLLRAELSLEISPPAVMVCGGGDGVGGLGAVAKAVILKMGTAAATSGKRSQVIVICGKNEAVKHDIESGPKPAGVNVVVLGFVKNMDEWMGAVDVIVTKVSVITCVSLWCIKYYIALTHQIAVQYRDVCMTLTVLCIAKP
jgi:1,2-diacylglycerol 3-beta-galactosyltransferase